ncbi:MAG: NCS2 family permease [Methylobacter tundripaludum]|nr:NCS2 family permease [Methylobacter tundripaludum]
MNKIKQLVYNYFELSKYDTSISKEIIAGLSTYLSLAYIFIVNPAIMSNTGMNITALLFATIVASAVSTIFMGLYARLPFALAPGLEMNGFFTFVVVGAMGLTWQQALGAVFWSGVLCLVFTIVPFRKAIIDSIPNGLKKTMAVSVGVFVMTIGLYLSGLVKFTDGHITGYDLSPTPKVLALFIGLIISALLGMRRLKFPAGMLIAIIVATIYCTANGIITKTPATSSWDDMVSACFKIDFIPTLRLLPIYLIFFLIDFYGSIGKFIGLTASTDLRQKDGSIPRMAQAMGVDAGGTILGAFVGTSSIITYVESAVGIEMGGRTGIVALVCGILMFASLLFTPLIGLVPVEATAGILIYVGYLIMRDTDSPDDKNLDKFFITVVTIMGLISFLTFSLDKAMMFGFLAYTIRQVFFEKVVNWYLIVSAILISVSVILPILIK